MRNIAHQRYLLILSILFSIEWIALAITPLDREGWALENALVVLFVLLLAASYRRLPLSRISYTLIFIFLCLHEIGAHYTYAKVPYDAFFLELTGQTFNAMVGWERNNFDRIVHFLYGLLLAYPLREVFFRIANVKGFWGYFLPLDFTMSTSMGFELIEWLAAELFGGDLGIAYLGTQGDIWDAHKDMLLASTGAVLAMMITALINSRLQRDFAREWANSLKVKHPRPMGEEEMFRLWSKNRNG